MESNDRIRKEINKTQLKASRVYSSDFQKKGTMTAELRQEIKTKAFYPSISVSNEMQDNIFDAKEDFGAEEKEFSNTEKRVAWIDVPEGKTVEEVNSLLSQHPDACLYRIVSNHPILTSQQKYAIESPELNATKDTFANSQVIRYPEDTPNAGQIVTDKNGKVQYRAVFFSKSLREDVDLRTAEADDFYASPEIMAEVNQSEHVVEDQQL